MYRLAWLALKLTVTVALCAWIVTQVDWSAFWGGLRQCNLWLVVAILILRLMGVTISSYKWQLCLRAFEVRYPLVLLERWYFVALFLNQFLPTSIGGDGYRIYKTFPNDRGGTTAVLAILLERLTGLIALLSMGFLAAVVVFMRREDKLSGMLVGLGSAGLAAALAAIGAIGLWRRSGWRLPSLSWSKALVGLVESYRCLASHPGMCLQICALSVLFHMNRILVVWLAVVALGARCHLAELSVAVAAFNVIGMIPISLGGLGLEDGSFMYLMGHYGLRYETGLSAMLLLRVLLLPISLIGGYFYLARRKEWQDDNRGVEQTGPINSSGTAEVEQPAAAVEVT